MKLSTEALQTFLAMKGTEAGPGSFRALRDIAPEMAVEIIALRDAIDQESLRLKKAYERERVLVDALESLLKEYAGKIGAMGAAYSKSCARALEIINQSHVARAALMTDAEKKQEEKAE